MADINQTAADLLAILEGGQIPEDLMRTIFNVSQVPLEFMGLAGNTRHDNPNFSWVMDRHPDPDIANRAVDGQDITTRDNSRGQRVWNTSQTSVKAVRVSDRARNVGTVDRINELSAQIRDRNIDLARDLEAIATLNQGAIQDDGDTIPGQTAGLEAFLDGKILVPSETGTASYVQTDARQNFGTQTIGGGGWENRTGQNINGWNYTGGAPGAMTESGLKAMVRAIYENTGEKKTRYLLSRTLLHDQISDFYFTASARAATLTAETNQQGPATAMTAVNTILTNYGMLTMTPSVLMPEAHEDGVPVGGTDTFFILDRDYIAMSYLYSFSMKPLATNGLAENRLLSVDWALRVQSSEAHGLGQGVDATVPMTA